MRLFCAHINILIAFVLLAGPALAGDTGAKLYKKHCKLCHTIGKGEPARQGPNLWGVFNRPSGAVEGFKYSKAFKAVSLVWTRENLDAWLTDPKAMIPGSVMLYKQKDPEIRRKIIEFVEAAHD